MSFVHLVRILIFPRHAFSYLFAKPTKHCSFFSSRLAKLIGTLRSDNGDVHENVAEKYTSHPFKLFSRLSQFALVLKRRKFWLELKRRDRAQIQTEMVKFIALPFPFSSKLKIWSFHVVVVLGQQRNVQENVMHVQSCCFAH